MRNTLTATLIAMAATILCAITASATTPTKRLTLDIGRPESTFVLGPISRGATEYIDAALYVRTTPYPTNDLAGYLWYSASNDSTSGVKVYNTKADTVNGHVYFQLTATDTLGLSTNSGDYPATNYCSVVLTNAAGTQKFVWDVGTLILRWDAATAGAGSATLANGAQPTYFVALTDTPASYSGQAGKTVSVKSDESGLEFSSAGAGDILGVTAGTWMSGGGSSGAVTMNVDTNAVMAAVAAKGYVTTDTDTTYDNGTGIALSGTTFSLSNELYLAVLDYMTHSNFLATAAARLTAVEGYTNEAATAYGWGDHSTNGYLTSYAETQGLSQVLANNRNGNGSAVTNLASIGHGSYLLTLTNGTFSSGGNVLLDIAGMKTYDAGPAKSLDWSSRRGYDDVEALTLDWNALALSGGTWSHAANATSGTQIPNYQTVTNLIATAAGRVCIWTGASDTSATNPANWYQGRVPGVADTALFDGALYPTASVPSSGTILARQVVMVNTSTNSATIAGDLYLIDMASNDGDVYGKTYASGTGGGGTPPITGVAQRSVWTDQSNGEMLGASVRGHLWMAGVANNIDNQYQPGNYVVGDAYFGTNTASAGTAFYGMTQSDAESWVLNTVYGIMDFRTAPSTETSNTYHNLIWRRYLGVIQYPDETTFLDYSNRAVSAQSFSLAGNVITNWPTGGADGGATNIQAGAADGYNAATRTLTRNTNDASLAAHINDTTAAHAASAISATGAYANVQAAIDAMGTGGTTDHAALSNLSWTNSGHTGTASVVMGTDASGAADEITIGTGLDLTAGVLTATGTSGGVPIDGRAATNAVDMANNEVYQIKWTSTETNSAAIAGRAGELVQYVRNNRLYYVYAGVTNYLTLN